VGQLIHGPAYPLARSTRPHYQLVPLLAQTLPVDSQLHDVVVDGPVAWPEVDRYLVARRRGAVHLVSAVKHVSGNSSRRARPAGHGLPAFVRLSGGA
jgi:hypothetical protein